MKRQTIGNSMIATVLGIGLLSGCSINQVHAGTAKTPGMTETMKMASPSNGFGMGGMMGGPGSIPASGSPEKSYGVLTIEGSNGSRVREVIGAEGGSFSVTQNIAYLNGYATFEGGGLRLSHGCLPQVSYLTVGDSGTVRFTRKNKDLFARITLRTRSGKLVPDTSKRPENSCSKEFPKVEKAKRVAEKILTKLVPVAPGKESRVDMGKTTVTVYTDKDFPVDRVPAYPAFTSFGDSGVSWGGMIGGLGGGMGGLTK